MLNLWVRYKNKGSKNHCSKTAEKFGKELNLCVRYKSKGSKITVPKTAEKFGKDTAGKDYFKQSLVTSLWREVNSWPGQFHIELRSKIFDIINQ